MEKKEYLKTPVAHIDIKSFNTVDIIDAMKGMSFSARDLAQAADIYDRMLRDEECTIILTIAGSTSAAGCMQVYADLVRHNMVDVIVATGATIVDMDFFEALGFRHYQGSPHVDDRTLRKLYIDRIYDTYINEEDLQVCDKTITEIADALPPGSYSSTVHYSFSHFLSRLFRQQRRLRPCGAPVPASGKARFHRCGKGFSRADHDKGEGPDNRTRHYRRRSPKKLCPGHGDMRRDSGI